MKNVEKALYHPSQWIVYLAANLIGGALSKDDLYPVVQCLIKNGRRYSLRVASAMAAELDRSTAIDLILDRLAEPLVIGCEYFFKFLQKLDLEQNDKLLDVIRSGLAGEDDVAQEAAILANGISAKGNKKLLKIIIDAYEYWLKNEEPYPVGGGIVPVSPRATLLEARNKISPLSYYEWRDYVRDSRSDVKELSNSFIVRLASESDGIRAEVFNDIEGQVIPEQILTKVIKAVSILSKDDLSKLSRQLEHGNAKIRYAAMNFLEHYSLDASFVRPLAMNLTKDDEQEIVDKAYRILDRL